MPKPFVPSGELLPIDLIKITQPPAALTAAGAQFALKLDDTSPFKQSGDYTIALRLTGAQKTAGAGKTTALAQIVSLVINVPAPALSITRHQNATIAADRWTPWSIASAEETLRFEESTGRANVADLKLEWIWAMTEGGWNEPAPVVHDGVLYLNNMGNIIQALDAATGELVWENRLGPLVPGGSAMRGLAIYGDKLFVATSDARLVALDARTGQIAWETVIGDRTEGGFQISSGPLVVGGKVLQGMGGCTLYRKEKCFISAYDAKDGRQLWKFVTVATTGTPGGDTWGNVADMYRAGGDTWITGSYDPDLDTTYWGVAQAKPWVPASRGNSALDRALYTS